MNSFFSLKDPIIKDIQEKEQKILKTQDCG